MFLTLKRASVPNFGPPFGYTLFPIDATRTPLRSTRPSLVPSSAGCAPLSSSSPPRLRLASRSSAPAFGSSWASTATPSLAGRPRLVTLLPSALAPSSILPTTYSMLHHSLPPTPPSPASCGGRDFVGSTQCPRYLQGILPRVGKLEWRVAGVDSTSAAGVGAPTTMRVRERGERWTMGGRCFDLGSRGTCGWEAHRWGAGVLEPRTVGSRRALGLTQIVACRCWPPPKSSVLRKTAVVAHTSLALRWTRCLRANVPAPIIAGVARIRHPPPVHHLMLRVCLTSLISSSPTPPVRDSMLPISGTSTAVSPLWLRASRKLPARRSRRKCVGEPRTGRPRGGSQLAMTQDGETRGLCPSVTLSVVYLKTPWRRERVQLGYVGVGVPQLHRVRTTRIGETCYCVLAHLSSSATAYLYGGMTGTRRYDHSQRVSQYSPRPPRTPPCLRRPSRLRITAPPSLSAAAPTPRTVSTYAIVAVYRRSCLGPATPRTVMAFRIQNLNGAQMDREVRGCYACVQALARRGGRKGEKYGTGRGAMEAPARRPVPIHVGRGS
ncbi:hypothetical protein B0H14DRAFT_3460664 [Mycena olivaceomarginata]|nr:hypothetical protein B0H14DRAFT_3460664 [Mycena olivaceomarginata]